MFVFALLVAGCGGSKAKKELIVGTEPAFAPFEFQKENSKDFVGFDIDLIQAIAKQMGYEKCTIQGMGFDALIPALDAKNIDVAIAGMTITDERAKKVNFSKPYYKSGLAIVVNKDNNAINDIADLKGKKIAVQIGTTGAMEAEKIAGAKITSFNTNGEACLELKNKAVDAVIGDLPVEAYFLQQGGKDFAKIVGKTLTSEDYGIAVAKSNTALAKDVDKALDTLKQNGEYDKLYKKWFGELPKK
ncbi:MAG: basic amino acid ABC transporter substrate-binding protein [Acholeplasmataceae bacterium]|nr:basic amino acid ABC transporter substrate-binding protein [Acholeplasmataceae bacterium]